MRKKLLIGLGAVAALLVVAVVVVAMQPTEFRVVRTATISAPPAAIFPHVNDLQKWQAWSPWAKLDPNAKNSFAGPTAGKGASFHWAGNDEVGEGTMTIIDSRPNELVRMKLEFIKPFEDTCMTDFTFQPDGDKTIVTWDMTGQNNLMGKAMCLFMDMDKCVGDQFNDGLNNLAKIVETTPATISETTVEPPVASP